MMLKPRLPGLHVLDSHSQYFAIIVNKRIELKISMYQIQTDLLKPVTNIMSFMLLSLVFSVQLRQCHVLSRATVTAGIIFGGDSERFAHFSAKNLIVIGLMGEKSKF